MISDPGTPTLDQLRVFLTVVEVGSFAGAARKLHRATSERDSPDNTPSTGTGEGVAWRAATSRG